jgi:hypothetical protein
LPERELRIALATVLLLSGVKLLEPPATGLLLGLIALVGLALLGITAVRRLVAEPEPVAVERGSPGFDRPTLAHRLPDG